MADLEAELARLTSERDDAIASRDQALRAAAAEHVARTRADVVVATLREWMRGDVSGSALKIALAQYDTAIRGELFPPAVDAPAEATAIRAIGLAKRAADPSDVDGSGWMTKASEDGRL